MILLFYSTLKIFSIFLHNRRTASTFIASFLFTVFSVGFRTYD